MNESAWFEVRDPPGLAPAGRSLVLSHGRRTAKTFVLLHGLTASPAQFSAFAALLHERGANVLVPRLPRHGHADRLTNALAQLTADELTVFGRRVLEPARALGERIIVAGFSLGGLLAAWIAQHERVERMVAIAPFLGLGFIPQRLGPAAARFLLRAPNRFLWWHPLERERFGGSHGYPRYATHAIAEGYRLAGRLLEVARSCAPATTDLVLVTNAAEMAISNRAVRRLAAEWARHPSAHVSTRRIEGLPPSHDIIEPLRRPALARRAYPALLEVVDD